MDDHLRALERLQALAERSARVNAEGWRGRPAPPHPVRTALAAALVALATRLDSANPRPRGGGHMGHSPAA